MNQYPLNEALQLPDKTQANIVCSIVKAEVKAPPGKNSYWNARVEEGGAGCYLSSFGVALGPFIGKKVILVGCEVGSYNGKKQLTLGKRGAIQDFVADFEAAPRAQQPPQNAQSHPGHINAPSVHGNAVNGQTVGMAVKAAVDIHLKIRGPGAWGQDDSVSVEAIARDLISISERIQSGDSVPF